MIADQPILRTMAIALVAMGMPLWCCCTRTTATSERIDRSSTAAPCHHSPSGDSDTDHRDSPASHRPGDCACGSHINSNLWTSGERNVAAIDLSFAASIGAAAPAQLRFDQVLQRIELRNKGAPIDPGGQSLYGLHCLLTI